MKKYPSLRKYFSKFLNITFSASKGANSLIQAIDIIKHLDFNNIKKIPIDAPTNFVSKRLKLILKDKYNNINRNVWELSLAIAIKDALRSGDLYVPESKYYVSFWDLILKKSSWDKIKENSYNDLKQTRPEKIQKVLKKNFYETINHVKKAFKKDNFAEIKNNKLKLKRLHPDKKYSFVKRVQKIIDSNLPFVRTEQLLLEVDKMVNFTQYFTQLQKHKSRPNNFYKTLISAIISQATNLGVVSMSASVKGITVGMLRHLLNHYIREETLKIANEKIVNRHHLLPLSSIHGSGNISSSDAQRFKVRAISLLSSHYPRYYGYYEKIISIHMFQINIPFLVLK